MPHHAATLQYTFEKTASALDFAYTAIDRRDAALSGIV
jgi:hypothetical protein